MLDNGGLIGFGLRCGLFRRGRRPSEGRNEAMWMEMPDVISQAKRFDFG